jgi:hypothetical protein
MMKKSIYQLALRCKTISDEKMGTDRNIIPFRGVVFTDYTVKGPVDEYLEAIGELLPPLTDRYPAIGYELRLHKDKYKDEKIVHFTAMKIIVDCVLALEKGSHAKNIFISHSSKDKDIIEKFTDYILQLGIGLSHEDIFCTSIEEMGIKNGEDIRDHIRENVLSADFSFLMISKNYKQSEICLNEMGAVWATENRVRYYLLPDVDFTEIGWLCDAKKADKLADSVVLDAIEEELTGFYGLPRKGGVWSRQRQNFVEYLGRSEGGDDGVKYASEEVCEAIIDELT